MMMKIVGLGLAALGVASAQSFEQHAVAAVQAVENDTLDFDLDIIPPESLSNFGSFKAHLEMNLHAALEAVEHEEVMSKGGASFRGLQDINALNDDKCKKCVEASAKWIVEFATKKFEEMCSKKPKCPFLKKMCEVYKKKPKIIEGFLFGKMHTPMTAFAYCAGKKECDMPKQMDMDMPLALSTMEEIIDQDDSDTGSDETSQSLSVMNTRPPPPPPQDCDCDATKTLADITEDDQSSIAKPPPKPKCDCICKGCIHHMTKFVLGMTIERIKHMCHKPKDDKMKKMCEWAKQHKDEVVGFLFAKVQPWKGAMGFCAGNGRCLPGPHHHHHHHRSTTTKAPSEEDVVQEDDFSVIG